MRYHLEPLPEQGRRLVAAAFPDYAGRKFALVVEPGPMSVGSYWDGGSRNCFAVVRLADYAALPVPTAHPVFDGTIPPLEIPAGCVIVEHSIFCGKDAGITFHVRPDGGFLPPEKPVLSFEDRVVLTASVSLKPSYNGIREYRFHEARRECGIGRAAWDATKADLTARGYLNKAGAITAAGRNALPPFADLRRLAKEREG